MMTPYGFRTLLSAKYNGQDVVDLLEWTDWLRTAFKSRHQELRSQQPKTLPLLRADPSTWSEDCADEKKPTLNEWCLQIVISGSIVLACWVLHNFVSGTAP